MSGYKSDNSVGSAGVEEFRSRLYELTAANETLISTLTALAKDHHCDGSSIVNIVESRLRSAPPDTVLPILYVIDSILKKVGNEYVTLFSKNLIKILATVLPRLNDYDKLKLFQLRLTWKNVIPKVILFHLDVRLNAIDPKWFVKSSVYINPLFLDNTRSLDARASFLDRPRDTDAREEFLEREKLRIEKELEETSRLLGDGKRENAIVSNGNQLLGLMVAMQRDIWLLKNDVGPSCGWRSPHLADLHRSRSSPQSAGSPAVSISSLHHTLSGSYSSEVSEMAGLPENVLPNFENACSPLSRQSASSISLENESGESNGSARISDMPRFRNSFKAQRTYDNVKPRKCSFKPQPWEFQPRHESRHDSESKSANFLAVASIIQEASLSRSPDVSTKKNVGSPGKMKDCSFPINSRRNLKSLSKSPSPTKTSKKPRSQHFKMCEKPITDNVQQHIPLPDIEMYLNSGKDVDLRPLLSQHAFSLKPVNDQHRNGNIDNLEGVFGTVDRAAPIPLQGFPAEQHDSSILVVNGGSRSSANDDDDARALDTEKRELGDTSIVEKILISALANTKKDGLAGKSFEERETPTEVEGSQSSSKSQAHAPVVYGHADPVNQAFVSGINIYVPNLLQPPSNCNRAGVESQITTPSLATTEQPSRETAIKNFPPGKTEVCVMSRPVEAYQVARPSTFPFSKPSTTQEPSPITNFRSEAHCQAAGVRRNWPQIVPPPDPVILKLIDRDPMAEVWIDGFLNELRFYGDIPVLFLKWDDPRELVFQNGARELVINDRQRHLLQFNQPYTTIRVGSVECKVRLGSPSRELYVNGTFYTAVFGGPPVLVKMGNSVHKFSLRGRPPIIMLGTSRKDLVAGKISITINTTDVRPIYLDPKPQRFNIQGEPFILQFVDEFQSITVNGVPMEVSFGSRTRPVRVFFKGMEHFFAFSHLPEGVIHGKVNVRGMQTGILASREAWSRHVSLPLFSRPPPFSPMNPLPRIGNQFNTPPLMFDQMNVYSPHLSYPPPSLPTNFPPQMVNQFNTPPPMFGRMDFDQVRLTHPSPFSPMNIRAQEVTVERPLSGSYAGSPGTRALHPVRPEMHAHGSSHPRSYHAACPSFSLPHPDLMASSGFSSPYPGFSARSVSIIQPERPLIALPPARFPPPKTKPDASLSRESSGNGTPIANDSSRIDVRALFKKLQDAGMVRPTTSNGAAGETSSHLPVLPVSFCNLASLRSTRQPGLIDRLYSGSQCGICSLRFQISEGKHYSNHLDWHFRENRRSKKDCNRGTRAVYMKVADWKEFVECEMEGERPLSFFQIQERLAQSHENVPHKICSAPVGDRGEKVHCEVCSDVFEQFFCQEEEEWRLKEAVQVDVRLCHPVCLSDMLKAGSESPVVENLVGCNDSNDNVTQDMATCIDLSSADDSDDDIVEVPMIEQLVGTVELSDDDSDAAAVGNVTGPSSTTDDFDLSKVKLERVVVGGLDRQIQLIPQGGDNALQCFVAPKALSTSRCEEGSSIKNSVDSAISRPCEDGASNSASEDTDCSKSSEDKLTSISPSGRSASSSGYGHTSSNSNAACPAIMGNLLEDVTGADVYPTVYGSEPPEPMEVKPRIDKSELRTFPPVSKGIEASGLCSIM